MTLDHFFATCCRTIFMYFFILFIMRLMGKREVGSLSVFDLIVSFMIADLSSIILETDMSLLDAIVPISVLGLLQIGVAFIILKFRGARSIIDGEPSVVVRHGKICDKTMTTLRYNIDDLMTQLREKQVASVSDVELAILETTGKLSVFQKQSGKKFSLPIPVILEGKVQFKSLVKINRSISWLKLELLRRGFSNFQDVYYASIDSDGKLYVDGVDK